MQNVLCHNMLTHRSTSEHRGGVLNGLSLPRCKFPLETLVLSFCQKASTGFIAALWAYFLIHLTMSRMLKANMNVVIAICLQLLTLFFLLNDAIYCRKTEWQPCKIAEKSALFVSYCKIVSVVMEIMNFHCFNRFCWLKQGKSEYSQCDNLDTLLQKRATVLKKESFLTTSAETWERWPFSAPHSGCSLHH